MFGIKINNMKKELEDLVEYIIYRAEFHAGSNEDEKLANSTETKEMIEQYANQRVIEELEKLMVRVVLRDNDDLAEVVVDRIKEIRK
tara:strand:- start:192 stop:452 length:261 start_codon:yes stop_codon:yes gene_type:complete